MVKKKILLHSSFLSFLNKLKQNQFSLESAFCLIVIKVLKKIETIKMMRADKDFILNKSCVIKLSSKLEQFNIILVMLVLKKISFKIKPI